VSQRSSTDPHFTGNCIVGVFFIVFSLKTRLLKNLTAYCLKEYNKFEIFLVILGNHFMVSGRITYEYSRNIYIYEKKVYNGKKIGVLKNDQRMVAVLEKLKSRYHVNIECVYYTNMPECADLLSALRVSHLLAIVNEILEISRIESGQTKLDEAVCNLEDIIKETAIIIRDQALETLANIIFTKDKKSSHTKKRLKNKTQPRIMAYGNLRYKVGE
jgi:hypothetical protein